MENYNALKAAVAAVVKTNGNQGITGANLQGVLFDIIDALGGEFTFSGIATPSTSPGTPNHSVFYICGPGAYGNFGPTFFIPHGSIGVCMYSDSWQHIEIQIQYGNPVSDNDTLNMLLKGILVSNEIIKELDITIGSNNDMYVAFNDINGNEIYARYFSSIASITPFIQFMSGNESNIVVFDLGAVRSLVSWNYTGTSYHITGTLTQEAYDSTFFYNDKEISVNAVTSVGDSVTDNDAVNMVIPYMALTQDVKSVSLVVSSSAINIYLLDSGGNTLVNRYIEDSSSFANNTFEINFSSSTALSDGLVLVNKKGIELLRYMLGITSSYCEFIGNVVNNSAYTYEDKGSLFGEVRTKDWNTGAIDLSLGTSLGGNIYNTVDCFRFPAVVDSITIPAEKDGVVEIYRSRLDDVDGVSETTLLATIGVKKGTHEYPLGIYFNAGDGLAFCAPGVMRYYSSSGWRIASYYVDTLIRDGGVSGWANGSMMCSVKYRFFSRTVSKPLNGINISIIGDSISTFGSAYSYDDPYYPSDNIFNYMQTWWGMLKQDGANILKNTSVSRTSVAKPSDPSEEVRWLGYGSRISGLADGANIPDVIIVLAGINDMYNNTAIGDFDFSKNTSDYTTLDTSAFATAYQRILMDMLTEYPASKIFLCTPFKAGVTSWGFPERNGSRYLHDINDRIRELAKALGVGLIDFYSETKISWFEMNAGNYGDTTHPNKQGHFEYYKIARRILTDFVSK